MFDSIYIGQVPFLEHRVLFLVLILKIVSKKYPNEYLPRYLGQKVDFYTFFSFYVLEFKKKAVQ